MAVKMPGGQLAPLSAPDQEASRAERVGSFIQERLREVQVSQAELARAAAVSPATLNEYVKGKKLPGPDKIERLARGLATMEGYGDNQARVEHWHDRLREMQDRGLARGREQQLRDHMWRLAGYRTDCIEVEGLPEAVANHTELMHALSDMAGLSPEELHLIAGNLRGQVSFIRSLRQERDAPERSRAVEADVQ